MFMQAALATGKHEEYKSPGSIKKLLLKEPLHGVKDEVVSVVHFTFPPGWVGGQHYHTGPVYVYVLKGKFIVHEKGKKPQTISAGGLYREPVGNPMEARNASTSDATEALVIQVGRKGAPLMVKAKF
jgi:quercetin dioxygenase-like cupin family protein